MNETMRTIKIGKVTINMGIGQAGEELEKGKKILEGIINKKTIMTKARIKQPLWNIRPGLTIGVKATLRKKDAYDFLKRTLQTKGNKLSRKCFDPKGNFGFGIHEHIELPNVKYDPKLGIKGLDVLVTLERPGYRVKYRKIRKGKIGKKHIITKDEAIEFMKREFNVQVGE